MMMKMKKKMMMMMMMMMMIEGMLTHLLQIRHNAYTLERYMKGIIIP
jgi:hypothetical protein